MLFSGCGEPPFVFETLPNLSPATNNQRTCWFHRSSTVPSVKNHLHHETSPYLLHHADNPVHWYAWKPEAFERARRENKLILVSIGYHTCHWCHVMERESFRDQPTADYMNAHFINIKVDREERPDVDAIHMEAVQLISGGGGWPLNAFLTPEGKPFYAGTYFPPQAVHNRPSWMDALRHLQSVWQNNPQKVLDQAEQLTQIIAGADVQLKPLEVASGENPFDPETLDGIFNRMRTRFDARSGGFGGAPKFPNAMSLRWLLLYHYESGNQASLDHVVFTLDNMIYGGIYDQLGGGFARYTVDGAWLVPHFEKMLYDNALLLPVLADTYRLTGNEEYARVIRETMDWIAREMTHVEGAFFAAQDADSEGVEGKFYVWSSEEIDELLGEDAKLFKAYHQVSEAGNWEETNILHPRQSLRDFAKEDPIHGYEQLKKRFAVGRRILFAAREQRTPPATDDKILLDWNALFIVACYDVAAALGEASYAARGSAALEFLLERFRQSDGSYHHVWRAGQSQYAAYLDDYAHLIDALLARYAWEGRPADLREAERLCAYVLTNFGDAENPLFYFTEASTRLIARRREIFDAATPSGNATMVLNLQRLAALTDRGEYRERARAMLLKVGTQLLQQPTSFARYARGWTAESTGLPEIALIGTDARATSHELGRHYLPPHVRVPAPARVAEHPLLDRPAGKPWIYVCRDRVCQQPVKTVAEALKVFTTFRRVNI